MIRLADPFYLYLLVLIPLLIALFVLYRRRQKRLIETFGSLELLTPLMRGMAPGRAVFKFVLLLLAIALMVLALARPQTGSKLREVKREGGQIMLAVDVSRSMLAEDFKPNRLERTKYAIGRLVQDLENEQIGMVVFAGDAYIQLPITSDFRAASSFVRTLSPDIVPRQGTSLQSAIDMAIQAMPNAKGGEVATNSRAIILITDGESHDDDPLAAANLAAEQGITIHTIGIGTPQGAPITIGGEIIKDDQGNIVVSKLDEAMLSEIATITGGVYVRSTERSLGLDEIFAHIKNMDSISFDAVVFDEYAEQFFYLLYLVLAVLALEFLIPQRKANNKN